MVQLSGSDIIHNPQYRRLVAHVLKKYDSLNEKYRLAAMELAKYGFVVEKALKNHKATLLKDFVDDSDSETEMDAIVKENQKVIFYFMSESY